MADYEVSIGAKLDGSLDTLQKQLEAYEKTPIQVKFNFDDAKKQIGDIKSQLESLQKMNINIGGGSGKGGSKGGFGLTRSVKSDVNEAFNVVKNARQKINKNNQQLLGLDPKANAAEIAKLQKQNKDYYAEMNRAQNKYGRQFTARQTEQLRRLKQNGTDATENAISKRQDAIATKQAQQAEKERTKVTQQQAKNREKIVADAADRSSKLINKINKARQRQVGMDGSGDDYKNLSKDIKNWGSEYNRLKKQFGDDFTKEQRNAIANTVASSKESLRQARSDFSTKQTQQDEIARTKITQQQTKNREKIVSEAAKRSEKLLNKISSARQKQIGMDSDSDNYKNMSDSIKKWGSEYNQLKKQFSSDFTKEQKNTIANTVADNKTALQQARSDFATKQAQQAEIIRKNVESGLYSKNHEANYNALKKYGMDADAVVGDTTKALENLNAVAKDNSSSTEDIIKAQRQYEDAYSKSKVATDRLVASRKREAEADKIDIDRKTALSKLNDLRQKNTRAESAYGSDFDELKKGIEGVADSEQLANYSKQIANLKREINESGLGGRGLFSRLRQDWAEFNIGDIAAQILSPQQIVSAGMDAAKQMYQNVERIDSAMVELKKVTDESDASYSEFYGNAKKNAKGLGSTVSEYINATADFARLGNNLSDSQELAKTATMYKTVGDDISSMDDASSSIISTMQAFGVQANDSMRIVDKFNAVGNNFAISSGGIGDALKRSASAMAAGNNTLDESIALITAANTVVQDPTSVGTALRTVSMRIRGYDEETESYSNDVKMLSGDIADLTKTANTPGGISLFTDDAKTTYKSTYELKTMAPYKEIYMLCA